MKMEFSRLRDSHPLPGFFESYVGAKKTIVSGGVRYSACPACGVSSDDSVKVSVRGDKWHCFSCEQKGDVVDAAAMLWGKSLHDAAIELSGDAPQDIKPYKASVERVLPVERNQDAINELINKLLESNEIVSDGVMSYLESRSIFNDVVYGAVKERMLIGLPADPDDCLRFLLDVLGRDLMVESGVWKKDSKAPGIIYRPLIFVSHDRKGAEFRRIKDSEVKSAKAIRYGEPSPFFWKGSNNVMIVEGAIDALSAIALGSERSIVGLAGAANWNVDEGWVKRLGVKGHVLIALDADNSGNEQAKRLADFLSENKRNFRRHELPEGIKDLNEMLQFVSNMNHT